MPTCLIEMPLWKIMDFVKWDGDIPNIWENKIHVPNHQPTEVVMTQLNWTSPIHGGTRGGVRVIHTGKSWVTRTQTHRHTHTQTHTHRGVFESDRQAKVGSHTHTSVFMYEPRTTMNTHHFMLQGWDKGQGLGGTRVRGQGNEARTTMNTHHFMLQGWDRGQGLGGIPVRDRVMNPQPPWTHTTLFYRGGTRDKG